MTIHPSVTWADFCVQFQKQSDGKAVILRSPADVTDDIQHQVHSRVSLDYVTPMKKGKNWLFEDTLQHQPRTGAMIMEGGPLTIFMETLQSGTILEKMALEVNGKMVRLYRNYADRNPSDEDYEPVDNGMVSPERALPEGLGAAYYTRFSGMSLFPEPPGDIYSYALPKNTGNWSDLNEYLGEYPGTKRKFLPWFHERFPDCVPRKRDAGFYRFEGWLDTSIASTIRPLTREEQRSIDRKYPIDTLFVRRDIENSPVYHVVDGRLDEMRVLINPLEAVDLYCEHVLLGREERFDFIEHGRPLD